MPSPDSTAGVPRVDVLGVEVSVLDIDLALQMLDHWITEGLREYVCVTGVHGVMASRRDERLRRIHNQAGLVTADGMPLVWWSRWQGWRQARRVYGPDLLLACCERSLTTGYRHFFYGGSGDEVADLLASRLSRRFPGLSIAGTCASAARPLTAEEDAQIVARINAAAPDIVWVGLGTPEQEYWMAEHVDRLDAPVLIGVGSAFDLHAGLELQAPRWMRSSGLEWLFRLAVEPRRWWKRCLTDNPAFLWLAMQQMWRTAQPAPADVAAAPAATPSERRIA